MSKANLYKNAMGSKLQSMVENKEEQKMDKIDAVVEAKKEEKPSTMQAGTEAPKRTFRPARRTLSSKFTEASPEELWYVKDEPKSRQDLGIKDVIVFSPSEKQSANGMVAGLQIETVFGTIKGIQVSKSTYGNPNSMYVRTQSRSWESDKGTQYVNDFEVSKDLEHFVLNYVAKLVESGTVYNPFWYMNEEYSSITKEELGLLEINVFAPSDKQVENGMVAGLQLETNLGTIKGIQISESNRDDSGALYIRMQSRSWETENGTQYANDIELDREMQAYLLRYLETLLVPNE